MKQLSESKKEALVRRAEALQSKVQDLQFALSKLGFAADITQATQRNIRFIIEKITHSS